MKKLLWILAGAALTLVVISASYAHAANPVTFPVNGGTGTSTKPTYGQLLVGNNQGLYNLVATSSLGLGNGTVTSVNASGGTTGLTFSGGPITSNGLLTLAGLLGVANGGTGSTTLTGILKGNGTGGVLTAIPGTDYQVPGNYITALTGDITASGPGSAVATLATVNSNVGSFTCANLTANAKGLLTAVSNGSCSGGGGSGTVATSSSETAGYFPVWTSTNGTPALLAGISQIFQSGTTIGIGTTSPTSLLNISASDAGTTITAASAAMFDITNRNTTNNNFSDISFSTADANGNTVTTSKIVGVNTVHTGSATSGDLAFLTRSAGTLTEKMRILANGNVGIGTTTPDAPLTIFSTGTTNPYLKVSGSQPLLQIGSTTPTYGYLANDRLNLVDNRNDYSAGNVYNLSSGACATADWTAANDLNSTALNFADFGHTSSGFTGSGCANNPFTGFGANSTYLFDPSGNINFAIGTTSANTSFNWFTGGYAKTNQRMTLSNAGNLGIGTTSPYAKLSVETDGLGATASETSGLFLQNGTAAAAGAQQASPSIVLEGQGWKTTATAASQPVRFQQTVVPVQGSTAPTGAWTVTQSVNGATYGNIRMQYDTNGFFYLINTSNQNFFKVSNSGADALINNNIGSGRTMRFFDGNSTEILTLITTTKNVGVGTSSPYAQLSLGGGNLVIGAATAGGTPGDLFLPKLGTSAGSFLAVDATGKVIATTTPSGGSGVTSVTGTYPVISSGGTTPAISLAFGTTTANSYSQLQQLNGGATTTALTVSGLGGGGAKCVHVDNLGFLSTAADDCGTNTAAIAAAIAAAITAMYTAAATMTNKRNQPRTSSSTTASTLTPDLSSANVYYRTTQTAALTINAPIGTPVIGETIAIYVDAAGSQTLTMDATYIPFGAAFPATLTAGKTCMIVAQYNGTNWKTTVTTQV